MKVWTTDPSPELVAVFDNIARTRMHDVPICNRVLWAINLLCLPGQLEGWPLLAACSKHDWHFPSGDYEFTVAEEDSIGNYHLCSLFSPALEFETHEAARLTAIATTHALFAEPLTAPAAANPTSRRAFLGLGR